jgi:flavin-dependent dehydrogenase
VQAENVRAHADVVITGAGPAGAVAAIVLARAGARVVVFDRARFPRRKLCGDTINPGALALLRRLGLGAAAGSFVIPGMVVTGDRGVEITGAYGEGITGRAILREHLDHALVCAATAAGARIEEDVRVVGVTKSSADRVDGVRIRSGADLTDAVRAHVVIAADGSYSQLARSLGLARLATTPRRWAVGTYFTDVVHDSRLGEMHIRRGKYFGVAQLPGGLTNLCIVSADRNTLRDSSLLIRETIQTEAVLKDRFVHARAIAPSVMLGPLAVDGLAAGAPGLLLAGDAAGFVDPMTGDGLRFTIRGAELAAEEALRALEHGWADAHVRLQARRRREFSAKWRFNRALRGLFGSPWRVSAAERAAFLAPWLAERAVRYAGDIGASRLYDEESPTAARGDIPPKLEERRRV